MMEKGEKLERTAISPVMPIRAIRRDQNEIKNRGPDDIKAEFLSATLPSMPKTETMNRCNLSSLQVQRYIRILTDKGLLLIEKNGGKQIFKTTERGKRWLEQFQKLRNIENGADLTDTRYIA